jgi:phage shock protein E
LEAALELKVKTPTALTFLRAGAIGATTASGMRFLSALLVAAVSLALVGCSRSANGVSSIEPAELEQRIESGQAPVVLDVRTPEEYAAGHIPGALNIPHTELASRLGELSAGKSEEIVVHCASGKRAGIAERVLLDAGYTRVRDLDGHMSGWREAGYPLERLPAP